MTHKALLGKNVNVLTRQKSTKLQKKKKNSLWNPGRLHTCVLLFLSFFLYFLLLMLLMQLLALVFGTSLPPIKNVKYSDALFLQVFILSRMFVKDFVALA